MAIEKSIPWCTVLLAGGAMLFHIGTLMGNISTSKAIAKMGGSVDGWADVGVALADALVDDLDELMTNVTLDLTDAINRTLAVQDAIDTVLGLMGAGASTAMLTQVSLLETGANATALDDPMGSIIDLVMNAMTALPNFQSALELLTAMLQNIKPALLQVGKWVETFSDKVQASVEAFGTTMDRVQKIFDQLMSKVSPDAGEGADLMVHDTYNLFDVDGDGAISTEDMRNCADIYAINALEGEKASELLTNYDVNGDGHVDLEEFPDLVEDDTISGIMATVLRAYSMRLSKVSGQVAAAKMRSEVALNVVGYFQLVCSKNLTKVGWVADRLTNGSLPLPFTADVLAQLALTKDDPNVLTTADVGEIVTGMMMQVNSNYTLWALDLMSTPEHWTSEGFEPEDQPDAVSQVTSWTESGPAAVQALEDSMISLIRERAHEVVEDTGVHRAPSAIKALVKERMQNHLHDRRMERARKRLDFYPTPESEVLMIELLHGVAATDGPVDRAQQALMKGIPAVPATLEFAKWLSWNATDTANHFQQQCFNYTGESSSALDAFNTQVQGMVKKISGFIDMMRAYSTPAGVDKLEMQVEEFASKAMDDVFDMVKVKVLEVVNNTFSVNGAENATGNATDNATGTEEPAEVAGTTIAAEAGAATTTAAAAAEATTTVAATTGADAGAGTTTAAEAEAATTTAAAAAESTTTVAATAGAEADSSTTTALATTVQLVSLLQREKPPHARAMMKRVSMPLSMYHQSHQWRRLQRRGQVTEQAARVHQKLGKAARKALQDRQRQMQEPGATDAAPSGIWDQVVTMLRAMEKILPTATDLLRFARKEVSAVSEGIKSLFGTLKGNGKAIFLQAADVYRAVWIAYFCFVFPLSLGFLLYAFWASGYFGGPQPVIKQDEEYVTPPASYWERMKLCCSRCCDCLTNCHDTHTCFWSFIIFFQLIVLLLFVISIVFVILAGVNFFLGTSCGQIYLLNDTKVCTETFAQLQEFLNSFEVNGGEVPLAMVCDHYDLKTCDTLKSQLLVAAIVTVLCSFLATLFTFELVFNAASLHERVVMRRLYNQMLAEGDIEEKKSMVSQQSKESKVSRATGLFARVTGRQ